MASTLLESSPGLIHLFRDVSSKLSPNESEDVVKSSKTIYGEQFYSLENQDLVSCFMLLYKLGYVSETKLTLVKDFVASQSNKENEIKEMVENFMASHPPQADPEKELQGRRKDFKKITGKLRTKLTSVINLHGSAGVGKTRLAKEISSKWSGRPYVFDLREAKDTRDLYLNVLNSLELTVPVGEMSLGNVVDKVIENVWSDNGKQPVLFVFDNVEHFTEGEGKEGRNLKTAFMQFLEKFLNMKALGILLTSRTQMKAKNLVEDYELEPLNDAFSEKILFSKDLSSLSIQQKDRKKLLGACKGKPLLLKGVKAVLSQRRKSPSDLVSELEKLASSEEKMDTPVTSKAEEDAKEKPFDFQAEGINEIETSVIKEMFDTLPSNCLKLSAVSISLFRGPFTASTAAQVLGINLSEAVAQLEGLVTSEIISVINREAKELMYDIHPLLRKYADSIKNDAQFRGSYTEAKRRFQAHFVSQMKVIAELIEPDYVEAYNLFQNERPNYEFAIDISLLPEFFSVPSEFHDITLIASVFIAMLSNEKQTELFHSWAEMCKEDTKSGSLCRAYFRCWEARQVLDTKGTAKAFEVLEQASSSLGQVQDHTTEPFKVTQGLFLYFKGEIYWQMGEHKKALECLQSSLDLTEEILKVDTNLARCYNAIGNCYNGLNKPEEAIRFFNKALKMREELSGSEYHYDMPVYKSQIGTVHEARGEFDRAVECYKDALRLLHELKIAGFEDEAVYCRNVANVYVKQGKFKDAIAPANEAYNIRKKRLGNHPETVRSIYQLGIIQANLGNFDEALELFLKAWEMEKSLDTGNHSAVWTLLIDVIIDYMDDDTERERFRQQALKFCQCLWKGTKGESSVEHKKIIDVLMQLLGDEKENRGVRDEDEKEALGFFDEFQKATDEDFCKEFDEETDNQTLNEMLESRIKFLEKIINLCERRDEHKKRAEHEMNKLTLYNKALLKAEFVGWKGNEKSTLKSKVEQLYQELNSKESIPKFRENLLSTWQAQWEQGKGIGETKESRVARERTMKGILQLCQELKKENLGRRFRKEALRFYEDLWTAEYDGMDVPAMKKFLREVKDLASSVGDRDRVELYQNALQALINTGKKPAPSFRQKEQNCSPLLPAYGLLTESEAPSSKRLSSTHESDSDETEEIEVGSEEIEVISQQDIKDAEVDEESEDEVEVNSEEEVEMIGWGFIEMENSCTVIHREIVKEKGVTWYLEEGSARLTFHPGAVTQPTLITCSLWSPSVLSPPLHCNETLVSNVIEVCLDNPPELKSIRDAKGGVTVALLHSARELEGYEVVIKQLVDPDIKEWIDLKTQGNWHVSGSLDRLMNFADASCPLTRRSSFAVIWRLKSFQFSRQNSVAPDFTCIVPDYPGVSVTIPSNSVQVNEDFCLKVKVHEFPSSKVQKERLFLGPALHISCSPNVTLLEAATIKIPLSLREDKGLLDTELSSGHLRILHYSSTKEESPTWIEITQTLETKATIIDGTVTFKVKHFSGFAVVMDWVGQPFVVVKDLVCDLYRRLMAQWAGFKAYLCQDADRNKYVLTLFCYPIHLESKVKDLSSEYFVVLQGEGTSSIPLCGQDRISVNLSESFSVKQEILEKFCLMFWEKRPNHNSLPVNQLVSSDLNVKLFPRWKGEETTELCTLYLIPRSPVQVSPHATFENWPHGDLFTSKREEVVDVGCATSALCEPQRKRSLTGLTVKEGNPSGEELERLAAQIGQKWKPLGRRLKFDDASLTGFDRDHSEYREKVYAMLSEWKQRGGAINATYQILYLALCDELVGCRDLAERFCCQEK